MTDTRSSSNAHTSARTALGVVMCCLVVVAALGVPVLATGLDTGSGSDPAVSVTDEGGTDAVEIDDALEAANGTVEVVLALEDATVPETADETEAERLLEDHAADTQEPVVEFAESTPGISVETEFWVTNAVVLEVDTDRVDLETFAQFSAVEAVHENFELSVQEPERTATAGSASAASDPVTGDDRRVTPGLDLLNAPAVWDAYGTRGDGVRVAVLDTGIDASHPDFELYTEDPSDPTYPGGWAAFDSDGGQIDGSTPYDSGIHGTHVSGTVAGGNASGTHVGVAPDAELLHGLVLDETSGTYAQTLAGMEWALEADADVISMSFGTSGKQNHLIEPVRNANDAGVIVVAAIGNDGVDTSASPGNVYDAIGVGAVDEHGTVPAFSGGERIDRSAWGSAPESWPSSYVVPDVVAHGVGVTSTVPGGEYRSLPGTSMATPHVAGTVALMLSTDPGATPEGVEAALSETAWTPDDAVNESDDRETDVRYGDGIVDAAAATDALTDAPDHATATADGSSDTDDLPPFRGPIVGVAVAVVALLVAGALLATRAIARETGH